MSRILSHACAPAGSGRPQAAASLVRTLSRLLRDEPDAELLSLLAQQADSSPLGQVLTRRQCSLSAVAAVADVSECRREFVRLFLDPRGALILPWESAWTANPPRLMGPSHTDMLRLYELGGVTPRLGNEPADHIALELGFAALLIENGRIALLRDLWSQHVVNWMSSFALKLRSSTLVPLYVAVAALLEDSIRPIRRSHEREATAPAARIQ